MASTKNGSGVKVMIQKRIPMLFASILATTTTQAAFVPGDTSIGTDSSVVLSFYDNTSIISGGAYHYDAGISTADLIAGVGFSINISAATAALGGTPTGFSLFGTRTSGAASYSYALFDYVDPNLGIIYAGSAPIGLPSGNDVLTQSNTLNNGISFLPSTASQTFQAAGTLPAFVPLIPFNTISSLGSQAVTLFFEQSDPTNGRLSNPLITTSLPSIVFSSCVGINCPSTSNSLITLDNNTFTLNSSPTSYDSSVVTISSVPLPNSIWLFASGLLGLLCSRYKYRGSNERNK